MTATATERMFRAGVIRLLMDHGPRLFVTGSTTLSDAVWWLVDQGLVTHRDGIFVYVGPVKTEAVAS